MALILLISICLKIFISNNINSLDAEENDEVLQAKIIPNDIGNYSQGAVSCDNGRCSEIGVEVLRNGGNAVDAAIATQFCLAVTDIQATGIGGGGKMLIFNNKKKKMYALNFRERSPINVDRIPKRANLRMGMSINFSLVGPYSIAVPGFVSGLYSAWKKFGTKTWKELIEPSVLLAYHGFPMHAHLHLCTKNVVQNIPYNSFLRRILLHKGDIKTTGSLIKNIRLAKTLSDIISDPKSFYVGNIAEKLVKDLQDEGSVLTMEDMRKYKSVWEPTVKFSVRDDVLAYAPMKNSGGPSL
ncbi:hypothetical protein MXB_768, partial [Myxobolus squamalis]